MPTRHFRLLAPVVFLAVLSLLEGPGVRAQAVPPQPGGAISGVVVNGATGAPVAGAVVQITAQPPTPIGPDTRQLTDDKGRFAFLNLPGDTAYTIAAEKPGYLAGGFGRDSGPTDPLRQIRITGTEWRPDVRVAIWRPGSIAGVIRDEAGDAVVGVFVRALVRFRMQGRDDLAAGPLTFTDDRGVYRLAGLGPGRYLVQVPSVHAAMPAGVTHRFAPTSDPEAAIDVDDTGRLLIGRFPLPPPPVNGRPRAYGPAFHPAAAQPADATTIDLAYGDDRSGVDVTLTPGAASRVSGVVEAPPAALTYLTLRLLPAGLEQLGQGAEVATALVAADGRFTFLNVPAGTYTIDAPLRINELTTPGSRMYFPLPPGRYGWNRFTDAIETVPGLQFMSTDFRGGQGANYSGRGSVTVGSGDVTGVVVRLRPNAVMSGRVVVEPNQPAGAPTPPATFTLLLDPATGDASLGTPRPNTGPRADTTPGVFTIDGIASARYWLRLPGNPGWVIKSVFWKGSDYANEPFDAATTSDFSDVVVTVTSAAPVLSGAVRAAGDLKPEGTIAVAFPTDPALWRGIGLWPARLKSAAVSTAGTYQFANLPAGEYYFAAIDRSLRSGWQDPLLLAQLARSASRVTLAWSGRVTQDVTAVVVR